MSQDVSVPYKLDCFAYGPRSWQRLAHHPGGIPDALRRRDPALLLLPLFIPALFFACVRLAGQVDVMHGNWSIAGLVAALAARLRGKAAVMTLRGDDVTRADRSPVFALLLGASILLNHRIVVVSEAMRECLVRRYPNRSGQIRFIPNGVSLAKPTECTVFHEPLRLMTVGSLIGRKRLDVLLRAVARPEFPPNAVLRIIGAGPQRPELEALAAQLDITSRVVFLGSVEPSGVAQHLHWADIFVFASESEGRPNAVLEAMAAGLPIIATNIPGVREMIDNERGLSVPVGDERAMAEAIRFFSGDPAAALKKGRAARQWLIANELTWQAAGRQYAALYAECVATTAPVSCAG
jgi:glycosyltransferase involved in cell wall biosynthesis